MNAHSSGNGIASLSSVLVPLHVPHAESRSYSICTTVHFFRSLMPIRARAAASRSGREVAWTIAAGLRGAEIVWSLYRFEAMHRRERGLLSQCRAAVACIRWSCRRSAPIR